MILWALLLFPAGLCHLLPVHSSSVAPRVSLDATLDLIGQRHRLPLSFSTFGSISVTGCTFLGCVSPVSALSLSGRAGTISLSSNDFARCAATAGLGGAVSISTVIEGRGTMDYNSFCRCWADAGGSLFVSNRRVSLSISECAITRCQSRFATAVVHARAIGLRDCNATHNAAAALFCGVRRRSTLRCFVLARNSADALFEIGAGRMVLDDWAVVSTRRRGQKDTPMGTFVNVDARARHWWFEANTRKVWLAASHSSVVFEASHSDTPPTVGNGIVWDEWWLNWTESVWFDPMPSVSECAVCRWHLHTVDIVIMVAGVAALVGMIWVWKRSEGRQRMADVRLEDMSTKSHN
jgi:hypothetical protein